MTYAICLGLFLPLVGFLIIMLASDKIGRKLTGTIGCFTILASFLCFIWLAYTFVTQHIDSHTVFLYSWIPVEGINADFTLRADHLTSLMTLIITGIGFLIHVYSVGYMEHDEDYARFFACMNFFVFSMLLLVLGANLLLLFVGWEGVGLASYLLIGYYYTRPAAAQAATKAFVMNRIGDLGFLLGTILTLYVFGTSDIAEINKQGAAGFSSGSSTITVLTLLLFVGAVGKSAQIPLQSWLPDAMEGPTPVSALIHAATMVTAGVYLVVRLHPLYLASPYSLHVIGIIGAATALYAALCALGQTDLKRVLAYSTVSQLGYMFLACGAGAFYAAMFHLTTHAFMKALLFLSAGNVVHMMSGTTEMGLMGGLSKKLPATNWLFLIGVLAMSGLPPLAAFFSKDLILDVEYAMGFKTLFYIGLVTAIITAFYLMRAYCLTFLGASHLDAKIQKRIKEAPSIMLIPVSVLAVLSLIGGFLGFDFGKMPILERFLSDVGVNQIEYEISTTTYITPETMMSIVGALAGFLAAAAAYTKFYDRLGSTWNFLKKAFYIDEIYNTVIVIPLKKVAQFIANFMEPKVFDGSINLASEATQGVAKGLQLVQSGQIRSYMAWMILGTVILVAYLIL